MIRLFFKIIFNIIFLLALFFVGMYLFIKPSNDRGWNNDQKVLAHATVNGDVVSIKNVRDFRYASTTSYTEHYYDKEYDLNKLKKVWYIVEPFSGVPGSAHTFLSFEFEDGVFLSVSIEIRKEKGESFHPLKGLLNQYELMYVLADERDVVDLRINHRKDEVYMYPIKSGPEKNKELFMSIIDRVNKLYEKPEFYNTLVNTCTTNIVKHVNLITPKTIPWYDFRIFFPANSDVLAYELGLIDTELTFQEARLKYHVNDKGGLYKGREDFSVKIRE